MDCFSKKFIALCNLIKVVVWRSTSSWKNAKVLFEFFNNTVYGKTMENERKRVDIKLLSKWAARYGWSHITCWTNCFGLIQNSRISVSLRLYETLTVSCMKWRTQTCTPDRHWFAWNVHGKFQNPVISLDDSNLRLIVTLELSNGIAWFWNIPCTFHANQCPLSVHHAQRHPRVRHIRLIYRQSIQRSSCRRENRGLDERWVQWPNHTEDIINILWIHLYAG